MSGTGGYNYGNDQYGYDYSSSDGNNYNYGGGYNYGINSNGAAYNPGTYSQAQPQSHPQPLHQHNQPFSQPYNPAETLLNNPAAQIGMQFGTQAFTAGQQYVNNNVISTISASIYNNFYS